VVSISIGPTDLSSKINGRIAGVLGALDVRKFAFLVDSQGRRFEPLQGLRPHLLFKPSTFKVSALHDLANDRMRLSWRRDFLEPLTATVQYDEIIVGNGGYISAPDVALGPVPARPMTPDRLAAVRRQQHLLHPHLLLGEALLRQGDGGCEILRYVQQEEVEGAPHALIRIESFPRPIFMYINLDRDHVTRVATQENDFPRGDVNLVVNYKDWRLHHGLMMPYVVTLSLDGDVVHSETRDCIEINPRTNYASYALPETLPFDPLVAARGLINGQWMHRALAMGAPISLDPGKVEIVDITPFVITLGGSIHHSMAVALENGVVVVDPPQNEQRSLAVIEAVQAKWPGKPISDLVLTHHHHDHSGGIRAYAAVGARLIVAEGDLEFVTDVLKRPHTIVPDTLSKLDVKPKIITVGDTRLSLGGGAVEIHRISSPHCAEDLVIYISAPKVLFNADLFNPGLVPGGATPPPYWVKYSKNFREQIEALKLDIELLIGAHGALQGGPYQELIAFTEQLERPRT
jgi:glyoxylase-like metal-dependent hydrolase (beta-lactamase superfamily II)